MSVMIRKNRRKSDTTNAPSAVEPTRKPIRPVEPEAPDRGDGPREAPDAGEGRAGYIEHEFTHGRSQS
jgi:hypothetical protein